MKVKIAYLPGEEQEAESLSRITKALLKPVKIKKSNSHPPYKHIYITSEKQLDTPCKNEENVV